jgi:hypothetical protein
VPKGKGILPSFIGNGISHPVANSLASRYLVAVVVAPFTSHGKLHEFGAEKPIS